MREPRWVRSPESLFDFVMHVAICAPDRFPKEDYLQPEQQLTFEKAFAELRKGMQMLRGKLLDEALRTRLEGMLEDSYAAYRAGEVVKGAHTLQDFRDLAMSHYRG